MLASNEALPLLWRRPRWWWWWWLWLAATTEATLVGAVGSRFA